MRPRKKQRHLPPCIYHNHGAYYYVKGGKWERLGTDLAAVLAKYGRRISGRESGDMASLIDKVLAHVTPKLSSTSAKQYRTLGEKLKSILIEFRPEHVKPADVARIKVHFASKPFYANRLVSLLRLVFAHALEWQLVESNPCTGIRRHEEAKRTRYMSDAEYSAIYDKAGPRLRVIMDLCYLTGQRISDVLKIRRADLKDEGIAFRQQKTNATLMVAWTPDLKAATDRAKALYGNVVALTLLHNRKGNAPDYSTVKIQWDKARKAAGVQDARIHDIRAKALTDAKRQGLDPQSLAGHTSAAMTARYIRLRETPLVTGPSFRQLPKKGGVSN